MGSAAQTGDRGSAAQTGDRGSAAQTGDMGSAAQTGDMGSAAQTGDRGSAMVNGEYSTVEAKRGGCLAVGRKVYWKPHKDSVLLVWWIDDKDKAHHKSFTYKKAWEGKRIFISEGKAEIEQEASCSK
jgi:hypothetical protein